MFGFFIDLFDTSDFPARWNCGNWDNFHGWLHILSDMAIWGAYSMIPLALAWYWWSKRRELVFPKLVWLFGAFIFCCGTTHLIDAMIFYHPIYRISGVMKFLTAAVSWATVFAIIRIAPKALEVPGILKINGELQQQLDRTREAELALARSNRDLEAYAGIVSHDLRNLMGSSLFAAEMARESMAGGNTPRAREQVSLILDSLRKMKDTINEMHSQALVSAKEPLRRPVSLNEVLRSVRVTLAPQIMATSAELHLNDLPVIQANPTMIEHLFINLLENSIKYRSALPPIIEVRAESRGADEVVTVADNGRGIPADELGRVFVSGMRASNAMDDPGSGLGLALCRRVMEDSGGTIQVRAGERGGTVFELRFPKIGCRAALGRAEFSALSAT